MYEIQHFCLMQLTCQSERWSERWPTPPFFCVLTETANCKKVFERSGILARYSLDVVGSLKREKLSEAILVCIFHQLSLKKTQTQKIGKDRHCCGGVLSGRILQDWKWCEICAHRVALQRFIWEEDWVCIKGQQTTTKTVHQARWLMLGKKKTCPTANKKCSPSTTLH